MKRTHTLLAITALFSTLAMAPAASAMQMGVQAMNNKATITLTAHGEALANQVINVKGVSQETIKTDEFGRAILVNQESGVRHFTVSSRDEQGNTVQTRTTLSGSTL